MTLGPAELVIILLLPLLAVATVVIIITMVVRSTRSRSGAPLAPPVVPPLSTLPAPPAHGRWYADPTGRFSQRWWDGDAWTPEVIVENGQQTADPAPLPDPAPAPPVS